MGRFFSRRRVSAQIWVPRYINGKEMYALLKVLTECCRRYPGELHRAQLVMCVDYRSVVDTFTTGLYRIPIIYAILVKLFEKHVTEG